MKLLVPAFASIALSAASLSASASLGVSDYYGAAAPATAAIRTVVIGPGTGWVVVKHGEIVKFVANGQEFAWHFDGTRDHFDLNQVAPQGALDHIVPVNIRLSDNDLPSGA